MDHAPSAPEHDAVVDLAGLSVHFPTPAGVVRAVDELDLRVAPGESWCLLGESGSGKTVAALAIPRLLPASARVRGRIRLCGKEVMTLAPEEIRAMRGRAAAMIFEQPTAYLDPRFTVLDHLVEAMGSEAPKKRRQARGRAADLLAEVRLNDPLGLVDRHPHELSGGMLQRVMIAMALAARPRLLIADEPTTALDLTVKARIIELLHDLTRKTGTALLLITHDCDTARCLCDHAAVMYAGQIVERGTAAEVFGAPAHPYTRALFAALSGRLPRPIPGVPPSMTDLGPGCRFAPRCPEAADRCAVGTPPRDCRVRCLR